MRPCATHEATEPDRAHAARTFDESRSAGPDLNLAACGWRLKCGPNVRLAKKPLTLRTGGFIVVYYTTFYLSVSCLSVCDIVCLYLIALYSRRSQNVSLHWSQRAAHQKVCPMKTREAGKRRAGKIAQDPLGQCGSAGKGLPPLKGYDVVSGASLRSPLACLIGTRQKSRAPGAWALCGPCLLLPAQRAASEL